MLGLMSFPEATSAVAHTTWGEEFQWGLTQMLLADLVDHVSLLWWTKTEDGQKDRNRPLPIPRPGVEVSEDTEGRGSITERIGEAVDLETVNKMLADLWD